jgi:hypothetical protein
MQTDCHFESRSRRDEKFLKLFPLVEMPVTEQATEKRYLLQGSILKTAAFIKNHYPETKARAPSVRLASCACRRIE